MVTEFSIMTGRKSDIDPGEGNWSAEISVLLFSKYVPVTLPYKFALHVFGSE